MQPSYFSDNTVVIVRSEATKQPPSSLNNTVVIARHAVPKQPPSYSDNTLVIAKAQPDATSVLFRQKSYICMKCYTAPVGLISGNS